MVFTAFLILDGAYKEHCPCILKISFKQNLDCSVLAAVKPLHDASPCGL